jgi:hypothetical protein
MICPSVANDDVPFPVMEIEMLTKTLATDPWLQTVGLLQALSGSAEESGSGRTHAGSAYGAWCQRHDRAGLKVEVTDRPSSSTITVTWCDASICLYGDQCWRYTVARQSGVCALTGEPVSCGDAVYKPRIFRLAPSNADAMILARHIDTMFGGQRAASQQSRW